MLHPISPPSGVESDNLTIGFDRGSGAHGLLKIREWHSSDGSSRGCDPEVGVGLVAGEFSNEFTFIIGGLDYRQQRLI